MIEIFDIKEVGSRGTRETPKLDYHFKKQISDLDKAVTYYRNFPVFLNSGNVLTRLLYLLDYEIENPLECFYRAIADNEEIALNLGLASSIHEPRVQDGFNFKQTLIVSTQESRSKAPTTTNWKSLKPLTVLYRPGLRGVYQLPLDNLNDVPGIQVLGIDIPMLAYMYALFNKERKTMHEDDIVGTSEFMARYVLPNSLYSQLDSLIVNHMNEQEELEVWNDKVSFSVVDHLSDIYDELSELKADLAGNTMLAADFLRSIPSTKGSWLDLRFSYKGADTTNTVWFETIVNTPLCLATMKTVTLDNSGEARNNLVRLDRKITSSRAWNKLPTREIQKDLISVYDEAFFIL